MNDSGYIITTRETLQPTSKQIGIWETVRVELQRQQNASTYISRLSVA